MSGPAWLPVVLAILLGTAAMVAGLIAWRAAGHSGQAQREFALSTQADNNANSLQQNVSQDVISERSLFIAYEDAVAQHDPVLAADARGLMDPPTLRAVDWWLGQSPASRPSSPFAAANPQWTTPRMIIDARAALDDSVATLTSADRPDPPVARPRAARGDAGDRLPHRWSDRDAPVSLRAVDPARRQRHGLERRRPSAWWCFGETRRDRSALAIQHCAARRGGAGWPVHFERAGRARHRCGQLARRRARERSR